MSSNISRFSVLPLSAASFGAAALLAGCSDPGLDSVSARANAPVSAETVALMQEKGTSKQAPTLIRAYKKESELEIWKMKADGRYALLKTYPICRWSGQLGPKSSEGDRQVPEGFYSITPAQMKPNSAYYLAFNVGYPNAYDRALGHDGGSIMVHGICSSRGCFSMTDPQIGEIYAIVRESFSAGQRDIQMQSYPFRMTAENIAKYRADPNIAFWRQLKEGSDNFEVTKQDVAVGVCGRRYVFNAAPVAGRFDPYGSCPQLKEDPAVRALVAEKERRDDVRVAELAATGVKPIRTVYVDGGQHPKFASLSVATSRPEALAAPPFETTVEEPRTKIALGEVRGRKARVPAIVQMVRAPAPAAVASANDQAAAPTPPARAQEKPSVFARWIDDKKAELDRLALAAKAPPGQ